MTRVRLQKDYNGHNKGEVVELRAREAKQLLKAKAAVVLTDMSEQSLESKESSDGNTKRLRSNNRRRR